MDPTSGTVSCGDSQGNAYTKDADVTNGSGTAGVRTVVCAGTITAPRKVSRSLLPCMRPGCLPGIFFSPY